MKTLKLYDRELKFMEKHGKTVIRRPEWNTKRNLYGVIGDTIKITNKAEAGYLIGTIKNRKHNRYKSCWVILLETFA
ncbi:hypothetical protein UFOVP683_46 [uncultured Caudovirales phage]|jgi:hypothetical protein|uniref:Uncharacterized protein n=1 Tax=uncultured Caudovirales phage TaxID=2100421 RepID=A0A6J5NKN6_9CAUD|nr:hypothetical protein UFOVP683_46 [uncultured Caudovirales phage]